MTRPRGTSAASEDSSGTGGNQVRLYSILFTSYMVEGGHKR